MATRHRRRTGLSLMEVVISTLLVGVVLVAAMRTVVAVFQNRRVTAAMETGPALARDLMSEVLRCAYTDPQEPDGPIGSDSGESTSTRADFDDVDDFDGWVSPSPVTSDGTPLDYGTGWQRQISVSFVDTDTMGASGTDSGLKRITVTVTVTPPDGDAVVVLQNLRSRFGMVEQPPSMDRSYVTASQLDLQAGTSTDVMSGTSIRNHGSDQ